MSETPREQETRSELTPKGVAETMDAVRRWFDAWSSHPSAMTREQATRLSEWDAMIDALGYDRDARNSPTPET